MKKGNHPRIMEKTAYRLINGFFGILGLVSFERAYRLADGLGWVVYQLDRKHRRIAYRNLEQAFGDEKTPSERTKIVRQVFANLIRILFEVGWLLRVDPRDCRRRINLQGWLRLRRAIRGGNGVLVLLAHTGNWELLQALVPLVGAPVNVLYRPLDFEPLNQFFKYLRSRFGANLLSTRRSAREVLKALGRGEVVGVLMDQNVDWYEGVFVDFFGHRAATNKGFALLAMKTQAPVLPLFVIREEHTFRVEVWPEIPLIKTGDKTKDIEANTQQYNDAIERFVRRYPDQWFWVHQRWKTRPYQSWPRQA